MFNTVRPAAEAKVLDVSRYGEGGPGEPGSAMIVSFERCEPQEDVDAFWCALTDGGEESMCGWLKDRYGLSWQIVPSRLDEMLQRGTPEQVARVTKAFLAMRKFDLAALERAYAGSATTEGAHA